MDDSGNERLAHDPVEASLTLADDRVKLDHWLPPQAGVMPKVRVGQRWISVMWRYLSSLSCLSLGWR